MKTFRYLALVVALAIPATALAAKALTTCEDPTCPACPHCPHCPHGAH